MTVELRLPPGVYPDVAALAYHADCAEEPSLSSSLANTLVRETPLAAKLEHPRLNSEFEPETDDRFDLGSAVHDMLSGGGTRIKIVAGYADWRKKEAQTARDAAREAGFVPLLEHQFEQVAAIEAKARAYINHAGISLGAQESVFVAEDRGAWLRAMMDSFAPPWINDFKVTKINLANDRALARHMVESGYDLRAAFYIRVAELCRPDLVGRLNFRWLFLEERPPHGMRIIEADATWREMGRRKVEHAIGVWARCMATGEWPHLERASRTLEFPGFMENDWIERESKPGFVMGPMEMLKRMDEKRRPSCDTASGSTHGLSTRDG